MGSRTTRWMTIVGLACAVAAGCGDDDSAVDDGGRDDGNSEGAADADADGDAEPDAEGDGGGEADAATGTLSVLVTAHEWYDDEGHPAEGATVAVDKPGGERVEETTGADGRATFGAIDWSLGDASITAALEGYVVHSRTGVAEVDGEVELGLFRRGPSPDLVELSGTALGMAADANTLSVGTTIRGEAYWSDGPDWSIQVEPGAAFAIVAAERHSGPGFSGQHLEMIIDHWLLVDHAAITAATTFDLDFATGATPTVVEGSFPMPARAESRLRTNGLGWITSFLTVGSATVSYPTVTDPASDWNSVEYTVEYVEPAGVDVADVRTQYCLVQSDNYSCAIEDGYPAAGAQAVTLLDLPRMIHPSGLTPYPLHDPIEWEAWDNEVYPLLVLEDDAGRVWTIRGAMDATSMVVPTLPSIVDEAELLGTGVVEASFAIYRLRPDDDTLWNTVAAVSPLILEL
ncbi:MAG: carboxypeptidase regulatory-like domain-containing protein [Deltaproteobacteria bacterium]|nr:carboxypeptidase regulatory-like domain-containing protein [Deltaproteobacteria bacterium]